MRVIADGWYAWQLPGAESFEAWLDARPAPLARLARRVGAVRGALLFVASTRRDAVAVIRTDPGWRALLLLRAALGRRRKLVALHFIAHPSGLGDRLDRWATRRALKAGHVLSAFEVAEYARRYGTDRFRHVAFPLLRTASALPPAPAEPLVVAGGRAYCDWPTLFAAAEGADWPLTVVCSAEDRPEVDRLNAKGRATVLTGLDHDAFRAVLEDASACAVVMREAGLSQGHVRLADAVEAGAPIAATATRSLEGYVADGETALLVPPGDPAALRAALDRLHTDPALRERLRAEAHRRACARTWSGYLADLAQLG